VIAAASFGVVFRAKLIDGCDVAIKKGETWPKSESKVEFSKIRLTKSELAFF